MGKSKECFCKTCIVSMTKLEEMRVDETKETFKITGTNFLSSLISLNFANS